MTASARHVFRSILRLGSGELLARLCSIATVILLGHRYGVAIVGIYALAMTLSYYLQPVIDFGLRHVGARLMAQYPQSANQIMQRVQRRRLWMAGAALPLTLFYATLVKLPLDMKVLLFAFSVTGTLYALSLDWAAWGSEQLHMVGLSRALVPLCVLIAVFVKHPSSRVLWWALAGNTGGYLLQAVIFRAWWYRHLLVGNCGTENLPEINESLALRRTSIMGLSIVGVLAFSSIDMLMLGVMSNPIEVGLYSAAYRVLNQVLVTYYLFTSVLYPQLARQTAAHRPRMLRPSILFSLLGAGVAGAVIVAALREPVLTILFGGRFLPASLLLLLLAWVIPLDFLTSYLSNAYLAWGMEKKILLCTTLAVGSNIVLNLIFIPAHGARAAAINTLISYVILLAGLALAGRFAKEIAGVPQPPDGNAALHVGEPQVEAL